VQPALNERPTRPRSVIHHTRDLSGRRLG